MPNPEGSLTSAQHEIMEAVWKRGRRAPPWPRSGRPLRPGGGWVAPRLSIWSIGWRNGAGWPVASGRSPATTWRRGPRGNGGPLGPRLRRRLFWRLGGQPRHELVGLAAIETAGDRRSAASAGRSIETVPPGKGEIAVSSLATIMPPAETVSYLVNLALAASLACGLGLPAVRLCQHRSAPLRHGVLLGTLMVTLLSPAAVWLAGRSGLALVRLAIASPANTQGASISDRTAIVMPMQHQHHHHQPARQRQMRCPRSRRLAARFQDNRR